MAPSIVDTPGMSARRESADAASADRLRNFEQGIVDAIPMARSGVPDDVARLILYCTLDLAEFMTGVIIPVDGGLSAS